LFAGPEERENHFVDVTGHIDTKLEAIHVHASQHPDLEAMDRTVRSLMLTTGERAGLPRGRSAEAFHVVTVNGPTTIAGF
jgi:LmbE family N-acetylglucosaminyl deacetylase